MRFVRILCFLLSTVFITSAAWSQATTSLRGTVTDAQGGVIGGVALQLVGEQTGFKRSVLSGEAGTYQFVQVPPGAYILVPEKPGFAVVTQTARRKRTCTIYTQRSSTCSASITRSSRINTAAVISG